MSFVDAAAGEINAKVVYYGPGLGGKTTNLQYVYARTAPAHRSQMTSLATETERTLFFDFAPQSLRPLRGLRLRLHLYTVPGPVFYDVSRGLILKGVDAVVFVADSQVERFEANVESLEGLEENLALHGRTPSDVPLVLQYNKRDLPSAAPVAELDATLNRRGAPRFEAVAARGEGVFDSLKTATRLLIGRLEREE